MSEKITREAKIASQIEWSLKVARFNNPACTGKGLQSVFAMPILIAGVEASTKPWKRLGQDFKFAWLQYKIFPSLANERLFEEAVAKMQELNELVIPENDQQYT